jgi:hypothetical protein
LKKIDPKLFTEMDAWKVVTVAVIYVPTELLYIQAILKRLSNALAMMNNKNIK